MCEICLMHHAIKHHIYSLSFFFNLHNYFSTHTFLSFYHHDIIVYDYDCWMCFFIVLSNIHFILFSTLLTLPIPSNSSFYLLLFTSFPSFLPSFLPSFRLWTITVIHLPRWRWTRRFFTIEGKYLKWYQSVTSSTCNGCIDLRTGTSLHCSLIYLSYDLYSLYRLKRSSIFSIK